MRIYLDNAATTQIAPEVVEVMIPLLQNQFGNPSSIHAQGREVKSHLEMARKSIASNLGVSPGEIIFTSGGTEADNMALRCSVDDLGVRRIITSPIEHHAVLHTAEHLSHKENIELQFVNLLPNGHIDLNHLEHLLAESNVPTLVSIMHANNEIGNLTDIQQVGTLCRKHQAYFHSDTVQTMGHLPMNLDELPIDFAVSSAHKFHGPKGIGFLYLNKKLKLNPFITGGSQERNRRGGTENIYGIVGMAKALELSVQHIEEHKKQVESIKAYMIKRLQNAFTDIVFNGDSAGNANYTVLNVGLPPSKRAQMFLFTMDMKGISCSGGSACSSGSDVGSHVLSAINADKNRPNVRFSFSRYNSQADVDFCIEKLQEFYEEEKVLSL